MKRLSNATLARPAEFSRAADATIGAASTPGIVHLGIGAFHRAHQAVYTDDILERRPELGDCGRKLAKRSDARRAEAAGLPLHARGPFGRGRASSGHRQRHRRSGRGRANATRLLAAMADPRVRIVSLTVTEKGYCHDPATGASERGAPRHPARSRSAAIRRAPRLASSSRRLRRRRAARHPAVHRADLRQPSVERPDGEAHARPLGRASRSRSWGLRRRRARVPGDDGRPHHAGDDRRGPRRGSPPRSASWMRGPSSPSRSRNG